MRARLLITLLLSVLCAGFLAAPAHAAASPFYSKYVGEGHESPLKAWLVFEVAGVLIGAFVSGLASDRLKLVTERGPRVSVRARLLWAVAGGARATARNYRTARTNRNPLISSHASYYRMGVRCLGL